MKPLITVGMPIYNAEALLPRALDSLLEQTFRDFEVVLSDNASTDGSFAIAEEYASRDARIRLHRQETNVGMVRNFQFVLDQSSSELFCWRAYDDWTDPNWLEALHGALEAKPECVMAVSTVQRINPDGSPSRHSPYPDLDSVPRIRRVLRLMEEARAPWVYGLYRREPLIKRFAEVSVGFPFEWAQDHAMLLALVLEDGVAGTDKTVFYQCRVPTDDNFRPIALGARWRHWSAFVAYSLRVWYRSPLSAWEKGLCLFYLPAYANRKCAKLSRLVRATLAWPFQRWRSVDSPQGGRA